MHTKDTKKSQEGSRAIANQKNSNTSKGASLMPPLFQFKSSGEEKKLKPFTVAGSGERKILTPKKPNGKTLYFFYGYTGSKSDKKMRDSETADLEDDVLKAAASGFKVVYDKAGTKAEFRTALYDPDCHGIYWSGHGGGGSIQTSDGLFVSPSDIDPKKVSGKLVYLILAACQSGTKQKEWKAAVGTSVQFQGWIQNTNPSETRDFTSEATVGDSWASHNGTIPGMELDDHINSARNAK